MRLTLRTLLAWMDDTLKSSQVREIGKQVGDSPFAQELTERINRVTRQRRLSVPNTSGPDATDPNVVAAYLDNDLEADEVAEFEKKCLTSDVNLAEVASVHQILSLLGQKVKVPEGARLRMYGLVKGREAIAPRRKSSRRREAREPVTKPIQPWVVPETPRRPWIERYGPAAACVLLIVLSSWAAWQSLTAPPPPRETRPTVRLDTVAEQPAAASPTPPAAGVGMGAVAAAGASPAAPTQGQPDNAQMVRNERPAAAAAAGELASAAGAPAAEADKKAKADEPAKPNPETTKLFPGSVATLEKPDGVLLRATEQNPDWERVIDETPLKPGDRVVALAPFRAAVDLEKLRVLLSAETELRMLPRTPDAPPAFELVHGQMVIRKPEAGKFRVAFAGQTVDVDASSDAVFGMERVNRNAYGQQDLQAQSLGVLCQEGEVTLKISGKTQTLKAMHAALLSPGGQIGSSPADALPPWLSQAEPSAYELQLKEQFIKLFHPGRPLLTEIVGALDDERPEVKQLAVEALKSMGDLSYLMPTLSRPDDPVARRETMAAIHDYMMRGPDSAARVREELNQLLGEGLGGEAYHMLIGYTPAEFAQPDVPARLVSLLSPEHQEDGIIGVRELALATLKQLTGRDDLGYNPDKPAGKGFDAWNDLLRRNELRPPATRSSGKVKARTKGGR